MTQARDKLVVIGHSVSNVIPSQTDERYYAEPAGISERIDRVVVGSVRQIVEMIIQEVEECAHGRDWTAKITVNIGVGPEPLRVAGELTITIKSAGN